VPPPKKQFSRPSIELGSTGDRKSWRNVAAEEIREGDLVGGKGLVYKVGMEGDSVQIWSGVEQSPYVYRKGSPIWAFH
jgi:hypothetical protein